MEDIKNSSSASLGVQSSASFINCSSSEAETRTGCIYEPSAPLGVQTSAATVRRAKPRREPAVYMYPTSAFLGVQTSAETVRRAKPRRESYMNIYPSAPLGVQSSAQTARRAKPRRESYVNIYLSAPLGVQTQQTHRGDIRRIRITPRPSATPLVRIIHIIISHYIAMLYRCINVCWYKCDTKKAIKIIFTAFR